MLTDQWPFRMSYILEVIQDADQRYCCGKKIEEIGDDVTLLDIYEGYLKRTFQLFLL